MIVASEPTFELESHVAPPRIVIAAARAIAAGDAASGFPTPSAVQAVIDAVDASPAPRKSTKPAAGAGDQSEKAQ
jgi:hypothetical protein